MTRSGSVTEESKATDYIDTCAYEFPVDNYKHPLGVFALPSLCPSLRSRFSNVRDFSLDADGDGRFHAPYRIDDASIADGTATVLLGMYLARVGIDYDAALKYFGHGPHEFAVFARKRPKSDQYYAGSQ